MSVKVLIVTSLLVAGSQAEVPTGICVSRWAPFSQNCYLISNTWQNFTASSAYCSSQGAWLVDILDASENEFVRDLTTTAGLSYVWIGIENYHIASPPKWTSGAEISYSNWLLGEPNNAGGNEQCVEFYSSGGWNDGSCLSTKPAVCEMQAWPDCGPLTAPTNGAVDTFLYTTYSKTATTKSQTATYTCDTGYDMTGDATPSCQADGQWSSAAPTCAIVDCGTLTAPTDGTVDPVPTTYGETATFSCDTGYVMVGSDTTVCQADGQWSNPAPTCAVNVICPTGWTPFSQNCYLISTTRQNFAASSAYCSSQGARLVDILDASENEFVRDLMTTSGSAYVLIGIEDYHIASPPKWTSGAEISYSNWSPEEPNNAGGNEQCAIAFLPGGDWNDVECVDEWPAVCEMQASPGICPTGWTPFNQNCYLISNTRQNFAASSAYCSEQGAWLVDILDASENEFVRDLMAASGSVYMYVFIGIEDYHIASPPKWTSGAEISYSNWSPLEPNNVGGNEQCVIAFLPFGRWNDVGCASQWPAVCEMQASPDCGPLTAPTNGAVDTSLGTTYSQTATYTCDTGYDMTGDATQKCQADGQWSSAAPTCTIRDCGALTAPTDGAVVQVSTTYGETATFSCDTGYVMMGSDTTVCQADGQWSNPAPTCRVNDCGPLTAPTNGAVDTSLGTTYSQTATYTCDTGYDMTGDATPSCQADGWWSSAAPTCAIVDCGALTAPTDGTVDPVPTTYGETATFSCDTGYVMMGSDTTVCQADGQWSNPAPTCTVNDCGPLTAPTNGAVDTSLGTTYSQTATYTCDTGYDMTGDATPSCQADGWWSSAAPTCAIVDCGALTAPTDGTVDPVPTTYGETATFSCDTGYVMMGSDTTVCQADGQWSNPAPTCTVNDCGPLTAPTNGAVDTSLGTTYSQTATYTCDTGYDMTGDATPSCQADGRWSSAAPTCAIVDCGPLTAPTNGAVDTSLGTTYSQTATYTCDTGYDMTGDATPSCQADGRWSSAAPTCAIVDCGALTAPTDGTVDPVPTTYGETATFSCDTGYVMMGSDTTVCQADGQWSNPAPTCTVNDCGPLTAPTNGAVDTSLGTTYSQTATYTCDTGYDTTGDATPSCQADGRWSSAAPTCAIVDCGALTAPTDGTVALVPTTYGETATFSCDTGYVMMGSDTTVCQADGQWSNPAPNCTVNDCGPLTAPTNGAVDTSLGTTYSQTATYTCDTGYDMTGDATPSCQADGRWSSAAPTCAIVDCGALTAPTDGTVDPVPTTYGETATFSCDTGYVMMGSDTTVCQADGQWSNPAPTCTVNDCGPLTAPTNGAVDTSLGTTYSQTATYTCDTGYDMTGDATPSCQADGRWSSAAPTCAIVGICPSGWAPFSQNCYLILNTRQNFAASSAYCSSQGAWLVDIQDANENEFVRDLTTSAGLLSYVWIGIENYHIASPPKWTSGAEILYSNWNMDEPNNAGGNEQCVAFLPSGGGWNDGSCLSTKPAVCEMQARPDCGPLTAPTNGAVDTSLGTTYSQTATYTCDTGYDMTGDATPSCQADGRWSSAAPTCAIVDCGALTAPTDGTVDPVPTTYGETATFSCDTGYVMMGSDTTVCQADGQWSNPAPTCTVNVEVTGCTRGSLVLTTRGAATGGIIYVQGQGAACKQGTRNGTYTHTFDFASCGIAWNDSITIVLQKNALYQTGDDLQIPVTCLYDLADLRVDYFPISMVKDDNAGQNRTVKPTASMSLYRGVVDVAGQTVKLTDTLTMVIRLKDQYTQDFDIKATYCSASTIDIIADSCPTEPDLFPAMTRVQQGELSATFGAFRTTDLNGGAVDMAFSCTLQVCLGPCSPTVCADGSQGYGRRKRQAKDDHDAGIYVEDISVGSSVSIATDPLILESHGEDIGICVSKTVFVTSTSLFVCVLLTSSLTSFIVFRKMRRRTIKKRGIH